MASTKKTSLWEGKVSHKLEKATADQIFPFFKKFFDLHKWFPNLTISYGIHGKEGEVGCIRYCGNESNKDAIKFTHERLTAIDPNEKYVSFEVLENNENLKSYTATLKATPPANNGESGCVVEWSWATEPLPGSTLDQMVSRYQGWLKTMAEKMESDALKASNRWEATISHKLEKATPDQIWKFFKAFFEIYKYFPNLTTSYGLHGVEGEVGCIRYCGNESNKDTITFTHEKLIAIDPVEKYITFEVLQNNENLKSYVATLKVTPPENGATSGSVIVWSFGMEPLEGKTLEETVTKYQSVLKIMAEKMEAGALKA